MEIKECCKRRIEFEKPSKYGTSFGIIVGHALGQVINPDVFFIENKDENNLLFEITHCPFCGKKIEVV